MKLPFLTTRRALVAQGKLSRREILKGGAATSLAVALPACGADTKGTDISTSPAATTTDTSTTTSALPSTPEPTPSVPPPNPPAATDTPPTPPTTPSGQPSAQPPATTSTSPETSGGTAGEPSDTPSSEPDSASTSDIPDDTSGTPTNGELVAPPWDDVPMCSASRTDGAGQGPFFIHNDEKDDDVDLFRQDIRGQYDPEAEEGTEMHLHLRILDSTSNSCNTSPVADVEVYIWHTDPQGYYSGFGNPGDQKPDEPYAGVPNQNDLDNNDRFCRGVLTTDANGVVSFRSYFPGWYNGRDLHIHLVVLKKGSASRGRQTYNGNDHLFTTQFYFEPEFSDQIHKASEPYLRRTTLSAYPGSILADEPGNSGLRAKTTLENGIVVAQMQILLDPKA